MWLTRESAPKDGGLFLVIEKDSPAIYAPWELVVWDGEQFNAKDTDDEIDFYTWMPLNEQFLSGLLPCENAPKDGRCFFVIAKNSDSPYAPYELAFWNVKMNKFCEPDIKVEIDFDYWIPLPQLENSDSKTTRFRRTLDLPHFWW